MKIGFLNRGQVSWTAGSSYTRSMVEAIASARPNDVELCLISASDLAVPSIDGVRAVSWERSASPSQEMRRIVAENGIDVLLPVTETLPADLPCAWLGWIPDFQHARLPRFFPAEQRAERDHNFRFRAENCDALMFSSEAVLRDYRELFPDVETLAAVVPFPSSFAYDRVMPAGECGRVAGKYDLPPAYAVVINQFWRHKNHGLVAEAVARAKDRNPDVFVVVAGMMSDSRDPTNGHVSEFVQRIFREKLFGNLALIGEVPGEDLVALLRGAIEVIQPSEFEGWNTTVEDALAFGKPVACSDITSHREQAPGAFFFGVDDAESLAHHLASLDWKKSGETDGDREAAALAAERERGRQWGARAIELCRQAVQRYRENPGRRQDWQPSAEAIRMHPPYRINVLEREVRELGRRAKNLESELAREKKKADSELSKLRERLAAARDEARELSKKYWRERQKKLRKHLQEAIFGRRDED